MLVAVMPTLNVSGLTGDMVWNAEGQVDKEPKAVTIVNGAYVGNVSEAEE